MQTYEEEPNDLEIHGKASDEGEHSTEVVGRISVKINNETRSSKSILFDT
jgi:hypothetical protein